MEEKVSVIIPTYNVEKYIETCINSIIEQTYNNIEIIIVDDGSKDNTVEILNKIAQNNPKIIIVTQRNSGSGPARNNGIKHASGKYVMFVDADDWIDSNFISNYIDIEKKTNADLITSSFKEENYKNNTIVTFENKVEQMYLKDLIDVRKSFFKLFNSNLIKAPHRILYKMEIIKKYNIEFPDLKRSQDIVFNYRYYNHIESLYVDSNIYYHYRVIEGNNINKIKIDYYKTIKLIDYDITNMINEWNIAMPSEDYKIYNNNNFRRLCYYIEARIISNENYDIVFNDLGLLNMVKKAEPKDLYYKFLKINILKKNKFFINLQIKAKNIIKKYCFSIFKKFKK